MLENGNGNLTLAEERSHFTAWALTKSPLLVGTDVSVPDIMFSVTFMTTDFWVTVQTDLTAFER